VKGIIDFFTASIQRRMLSSFTIVSVLVLAMVIGGFYQLNQVRNSAVEIPENGAQLAELQNLILTLTSLEANLERLFVIGGAQFQEDIYRDLEAMTTALKTQEGLADEADNDLAAAEVGERSKILAGEISNLVETDYTNLDSRDINEKIISVYSQIDELKALTQELTAEELSQLQNNALEQETIVSNVTTQFLVLGSLVVLIVIGASVAVSRSIALPLAGLAETATKIAEGDLDLETTVEGPNEVIRLGEAFNSMTAQLRDLINSLEQRIFDRTRRLEIIATLGEQLNAILDADELLQAVVDQTKENFGYYHAHIYLLDDSGETLVVAAGTGHAGEEMKAQSHSIPFKAETSLVARAARSCETIIINDVQQAEDWLPNPLLPNTQAEMAVPIIQKGQVIGVLDVQEDQIDGLDEGDAGLLRSLANQVAVALANAQLFTETTQAREEAELAQKDIEIANTALEAQVWQTTGQAELNQKMQGEQDISTLANSVVQQLCHYLGAQIGALYTVDDNSLSLVGQYAYDSKKRERIKFGQGLVGQATVEKKPMIMTDIPDDYIIVSSGLGETAPKHIMVFPFMYENQVLGVVEMGTLIQFTEPQKEFLQTALNSIAIAFNTAQARDRINELLTETQQQAEELQAQSEELRVANEELESQTKSLRVSEGQLKEKADALEESSAALQEKQIILDEHNQELKAAQQELEQKAEELALASKYKSEFLANMSHELRTPLNSLLILARMLAQNDDGNLTPDQVESAQVIYSGGTDLLNLINDILDLSKVEAGQMVFSFESMPLTDLVSSVHMQFDPVAEEKGLDLNTNLADDLPDRIRTDPQRVKQIVKNLLSNAFKFTSEGSVSLNIYRPDSDVDLARSGLDPSEAVAIRITDTGIGMTSEQQKVIFEAFQQADGSTSRQYGGTGLGLSISRELVANLGGQVDVKSEPDQGSTFTLYLPLEKYAEDTEESSEAAQQTTKESVAKKPKSQQKSKDVPAQPAQTPWPALADDRDNLNGDNSILLIVEDDQKFAKIMVDYAHQKAFKCLVAGDGRSGLELVNTYHPNAVILDLNLPDISGWDVLEILKNDPTTRHIPVHIMSVDDEVLDAYKKGAMGYLTKPVDQENLDGAFQEIERFISQDIKALLLVEDDAKSRLSIRKLLDGSDVQISEAETGRQALDLLQKQHFDCMILDLSLPDMSGFEVLNKINTDNGFAKCPVIVNTGRDLTPEESTELMQYVDRVIVKGVKSPERLLDETALFLHRVVADMPQEKQQTIKQLYKEDNFLEGKKVLVVDDDMRNSFALSKLLSDKGIIVRMAQNGQDALDLLAEEPDVDLILMDIMMPIMDGYEATKHIRAQRELNGLPILALTAKAMKGDREKCLAAGANDYLSKPIDVDRLFSMLRVWLYQ